MLVLQLTDLLAFMILFFLIFVAFACGAHIVFGACHNTVHRSELRALLMLTA